MARLRRGDGDLTMAAFIDMSGKTCGQLTVLSLAGSSKAGKVMWLCRCSCGNEATVYGNRLRNGHTQSCGCKHRPALDRFAENIALTDSGCIEWIGGLNGVGYGQFYVGKRERGKTSQGDTGKGYAHRWSYEYHMGPIPKGLFIDHLCRNTRCVNPDHLEPVTPRENVLRGVAPAALHAKKTHCPAGHEYTGDNLYIHPTKGMRFCRACGRAQAQRKRDMKKAS